LSTGLTIAELQRQVRQLKEAKGFDITLEHRLAYLTTEVGEVAREVLKLSRGGNKALARWMPRMLGPQRILAWRSTT